jgi:hypothetical protein
VTFEPVGEVNHTIIRKAYRGDTEPFRLHDCADTFQAKLDRVRTRHGDDAGRQYFVFVPPWCSPRRTAPDDASNAIDFTW